MEKFLIIPVKYAIVAVKHVMEVVNPNVSFVKLESF